jgi:hypothetical protein
VALSSPVFHHGEARVSSMLSAHATAGWQPATAGKHKTVVPATAGKHKTVVPATAGKHKTVVPATATRRRSCTRRLAQIEALLSPYPQFAAVFMW